MGKRKKRYYGMGSGHLNLPIEKSNALEVNRSCFVPLLLCLLDLGEKFFLPILFPREQTAPLKEVNNRRATDYFLNPAQLSLYLMPNLF